MVQVLKQSTPWGEVAQGFGKGLGETFSQEVERGITNQGIGQISQGIQTGQLTDRMSIYQSLIGIPGMTPEKLQVYMPMIEEMVQRQGLRQLGEDGALPSAGGGVPGGQAPVQVGVPQGTPQAQATDYTGQFATPAAPNQINELSDLLSPEMAQNVWSQKIVSTPQLEAQVASQLIEKSPGYYSGRTDLARQDAAKMIDAQNKYIDEVDRVKGRLDTTKGEIRTGIEEMLARRLQTDVGKLDSKIPVGFRERALQRAIGEADNTRASVDSLVKKYSKELLADQRRFAEFEKLDATPMIGEPSAAVFNKLATARDFFEKKGDMEDFRAFLVNKGFSEAGASALAYPLDAQQKQAIAKWNKKNGDFGTAMTMRAMERAEDSPILYPVKMVKDLLKRGGLDLQNADQVQAKIDKMEDEMSDYLLDEVYKPGTSLETLSLAMADYNLPNDMLYKKVAERVESGDMELEGFQERELQAARPVLVTPVDLWNATGLNPTVERPQMSFSEMLRRKFGR